MISTRLFKRRRIAKSAKNKSLSPVGVDGGNDFQVEVFSEDLKVVRNFIILLWVVGFFSAVNYIKIFNANSSLYGDVVKEWVDPILYPHSDDYKFSGLSASSDFSLEAMEKSGLEPHFIPSVVASVYSGGLAFKKEISNVDVYYRINGTNRLVGLSVKPYNDGGFIESDIKKRLDVESGSGADDDYRKIIEKCSSEHIGIIRWRAGFGRGEIKVLRGSGVYVVRPHSYSKPIINLYFTFAPSSLGAIDDFDCLRND